jgi:hypothetical protein
MYGGFWFRWLGVYRFLSQKSQSPSYDYQKNVIAAHLGEIEPFSLLLANAHLASGGDSTMFYVS